MRKTRNFPATVIALAIILSLAIGPAAWADDDTKKTTTSSPKMDGSMTAPADGGAKESRSPSALETELSQLKEELNAQRAILDAQQARIAELESRLHTSTAEPAIPASGSRADSAAAVPVASQPAMGIVAPVPGQSGGSAENRKKSPLSFKLGPPNSSRSLGGLDRNLPHHGHWQWDRHEFWFDPL